MAVSKSVLVQQPCGSGARPPALIFLDLSDNQIFKHALMEIKQCAKIVIECRMAALRFGH
jgi:hypothetical protein